MIASQDGQKGEEGQVEDIVMRKTKQMTSKRKQKKKMGHVWYFRVLRLEFIGSVFDDHVEVQTSLRLSRCPVRIESEEL